MIINEKIRYLVGSSRLNTEPFKPFDEKVISFLNSFSRELGSFKNLINYPDLKSLSFWCRKNNFTNMKKKYDSLGNRLGVGLIFHITPSNIPTNFAYSLIFGLLSGNANIIKAPSKNFEQINIICKILNKLLSKNILLKNKIAVIKYKNNKIFTKEISSICNARVIWGGDKTINDLRSFQINERAIDLTFADRYSFCIISSNKLKKLSELEFNNLIKKFYNDTYLVDQNACSSPHLIVWLGKQNEKLKEKFWKKLHENIKIKYDLSASAVIEKYSDLCKYAASLKNIKNIKNYSNLIYKIKLKNVDDNNHLNKGKWGLFFEYDVKDLNKIAKIINNKYQTVTYFGVDKSLIKNFVFKNKLKGIDRIVPIGQSLDIDLIWDGRDVITILSRGLKTQ
jgi:hypothetical protein